MMDGNFKVGHLHPINPDDEVWLSNEFGFMVELSIKQMQLGTSWSPPGSGGWSVPDTGCFVPHSIMDFQKGERQMNMDYALCKAVAYNLKGITRAVTFYDINCQYNEHLRTQVNRGPFLTMVPELTIVPGIGLWHVYGHQGSCYVRYALNFIEGISRIDGEIMETLLAPLNLISHSTQGMSSPHRKECLNFQMNDSNCCKMIHMKRTLCWKFKGVKCGIAKSGKAFDRLNEVAPESSKTLWLVSERVVQSNRIHDPTVMDICEINIWKEENHARHASPSHQSVATWISMRLAIEEAQIALLLKQCDRVQGQIDGFTQSTHVHFGDGFDDEFTETLNTYPNTPELTIIPLPSNVGLDQLKHCLAEDLIPLEMSLHEGQANDALHNLQIHLQAKSQALKTRAWSQVMLVEQAMSLNASIYNRTQKQIMKLGLGQHQLQKYQPLLWEQLKISTAVGDPNARGQQNESLAWFWSLNINLSGLSELWNDECEFRHPFQM
ncbi:uncharacterized protein EDB91DRAFT_1245331 [Suillus paluster]|uniref:uncharacterized protein n=1 Tax=Suillus paluster TaxID=48578 RepID=UPI001B868D8C|nr:uncharacterized protein EDB91DRAFT_1245331 [Suillus paluster]KAG1747846.1 hypothetical protein EDB91DRAFT_1245331 [Suillus paluster]